MEDFDVLEIRREVGRLKQLIKLKNSERIFKNDLFDGLL